MAGSGAHTAYNNSSNLRQYYLILKVPLVFNEIITNCPFNCGEWHASQRNTRSLLQSYRLSRHNHFYFGARNIRGVITKTKVDEYSQHMMQLPLQYHHGRPVLSLDLMSLPAALSDRGLRITKMERRFQSGKK